MNDILEASFHAHFFLHLRVNHAEKPSRPLKCHVSVLKVQSEIPSRRHLGSKREQKDGMLDACDILTESIGMLGTTYEGFRIQAESLGWKLHSTMLNPRESRLLLC